MIESMAFDCEFAGFKCRALNAARVDSNLLGGDEAFETYDILSSFYWDGYQYTVSLYSKNIDVSELAKERGGGGHAGASGFNCAELPYDMS
jgi:nanoRNase/pAp phosphatase (c-di-AMP/oligoRNAs hydrolase)